MTSPSPARDPHGMPAREIAVSCFCLHSEMDYVLPADPEAPSRTRSHGNQRGVLLSSALTTNVHRLAEVDAACGGRESWGVGRTRATRYKRLHRRSSAGWSSRHLACPLKAVVLAAPAN